MRGVFVFGIIRFFYHEAAKALRKKERKLRFCIGSWVYKMCVVISSVFPFRKNARLNIRAGIGKVRRLFTTKAPRH